MSTFNFQGENYRAGIGYLSLPVDIQRDKYVGLCYRTNTVSIRLEDGGFYNRVPISEENLNFIDFPERVTDLGSPVVYISDDLKGQIYVVSVFSNSSKLGDNKEHQFKFKRRLNGGVVEVVGNSKTKTFSINIISQSELSSTFQVNVFNKTKTSLIKLECGGDIELFSHKNTNIKSFESNILEVIDEKEEEKTKITQTSKEIVLEGNKIILNKGDQAMLRGDVVKDLITSLIDTLIKTTVTTPDGKFPLDTLTDFTQLKPELEKILSKKAFLE